MARKSKKTELLEIMTDILSEYEDCIHRADITKCGLCIKYMDNYDCDKCPMDVFGDELNFSYPCMNRNCVPVNCEFIDPDDIELKLVISFYKEIIAKIESMTTDAVRKSSFKFLIKIDNNITKTVTNLNYLRMTK